MISRELLVNPSCFDTQQEMWNNGVDFIDYTYHFLLCIISMSFFGSFSCSSILPRPSWHQAAHWKRLKGLSQFSLAHALPVIKQMMASEHNRIWIHSIIMWASIMIIVIYDSIMYPLLCETRIGIHTIIIHRPTWIWECEHGAIFDITVF